MRTALKMGLATLAFAAVHSALASTTAKRRAARVAGERQAHAGYRLFFVGQALLTSGLLAAYGSKLPKHTLYRIDGVGAGLLRACQCVALFELWRAAHHVGVARLAGLENWRAWRERRPVPAGPYAQGPEIGPDGQLLIGAAFLWTRHPLNFLGIPIFWLTPHMTTRRLAFNLVSSVYFVLGSLHEEKRLKAGYGIRYRAYCNGPVSFFWPGKTIKRAVQPTISPISSVKAEAGMTARMP